MQDEKLITFLEKKIFEVFEDDTFYFWLKEFKEQEAN